MGHLNVQHLLPKIEELKSLLYPPSNELDIFGYTETFLKSYIPKSQIGIEGFKCERRDRKRKSGGGVVIYINQNISYKRRTDLEVDNVEIIWIETDIPHTKPILIGCLYRPESKASWYTDFEIMMDFVFKAQSNEIILMGDFNLNLLGKPNQRWLDCINTYQLEQVIIEPTRVTATTQTLIDHIYMYPTQTK